MDRRVKAVKKDRTGNIVALCNAGENWSPRRKKDVIRDIDRNRSSYYVEEIGRRAYLRVVNGCLQTSTAEDNQNRLDRLPAI
ncbi:MAG TPA: hypothetical protein VFQ61_03725 [Polyangiaceae bacterium]|nr:hypothetical protein [Polyangiaceae bacterium]